MSKNTILTNIKSALNHNAISANQVRYEQPYQVANNDKIAQYKALQEMNKAIVYEATDAKSTLEQALKELDSVNVLWTQNLPCEKIQGFNCIDYDKSVEELRSELFSADTSVVEAICGVSALGIVGVRSDVKSPRLASLITPKCVVLLNKKNIVDTLFDGVQKLKDTKDGILPTNMIFIAGPSRTADIELQTVFGVHGPQSVSVVLY